MLHLTENLLATLLHEQQILKKITLKKVSILVTKNGFFFVNETFLLIFKQDVLMLQVKINGLKLKFIVNGDILKRKSIGNCKDSKV